ncbi:glycosyltransferase family 4 protein [Cellulomonas telluris]|uniref:glycosyltransferase family 4 protein n=1 Tax=Cellulomonas telluris TaxID=2306636 RepID=UPI0010A86D83|nr:glycosyltransferase family 4 protein [Cellulomonas telluris]
MTGARPRVGVLYPAADPLSRDNWSGSPAGIASGLESQGVDVVPVGTRTAGAVPRARAAWARVRSGTDVVGARSAARVAARTALLRDALRRAGRLDGLVAMGTELYALSAVRHGAPTVTYDDATLQQQWRNADSDVRGLGLPADVVTDWFGVQAASSRAADACCVSTGWAARSFVDDLGVATERVRVVGMGHRPRAAVAIGRDWAAPRFLFVGVDWRRKNGAAVVRAFREVRAAHPAARLDVVGEHGPLDEPGVVGHGLLPRSDASAQARLDGLFARATAFVLPSRYDPSPIAYLEAASVRLPVVATTEGGAGELLGPAALTVHPDDDRALVAAMLRLTDPATARRLGAEAARRAADASWHAVAGRLLAALEESGRRPLAGTGSAPRA